MRQRSLAWAAAWAAVLTLETNRELLAQTLPPGCGDADREACRYVSNLAFPVNVVDGLSIFDSARNYTVEFLVRYPIGAPGPLPVVLWNHGGSPSSRGDTRSAEWGATLAGAGYVVIHPARVVIPNPQDHAAECLRNGVTSPSQCTLWASQHLFAPETTTFLLDHLGEVEALVPALSGLLDVDSVVVGGHSAGSTTVLRNAGAHQQFLPNGPVHGGPGDPSVDPRIDVFLASGPQGPAYAGFGSGFLDGSNYAAIAKPFLFITGVGDQTGEPSEARTAGWHRAAPGDKYLLWDSDPVAVHETMNIHKCNGIERRAHCRWIASAGLAYVDAHVRGRQEARDWLASGALAILTGGKIELHRR
jgi:dienelactone hydrolase